MFTWKKMGKLFDPTELKKGGWMNEYAQSPSVLIFDDYVRIYFSSRALPDQNGQFVSRLGYIDVDRKNLMEIKNICKKPILELGELGSFDEFGTYPASVIKIGDDIRVYYAGWTRCESVPFNAAIGIAYSYDNGNTFSRIYTGPVLSYSPDEPFVLGSPKIRKFGDMWYLWYSSGYRWVKTEGRPEPSYKIRMAYSSDGIEWTRLGKNILASVLEEHECQASADVFNYKGKYHMFFSYRYNVNFRHPGRGYRIGYAFSDDLINWKRDDVKAGIVKSEEGWDSESISYCHIFEVDDEIYMLYQGNEMGRVGFGLAKLIEYN